MQPQRTLHGARRVTSVRFDVARSAETQKVSCVPAFSVLLTSESSHVSSALVVCRHFGGDHRVPVHLPFTTVKCSTSSTSTLTTSRPSWLRLHIFLQSRRRIAAFISLFEGACLSSPRGAILGVQPPALIKNRNKS